MGSGVFQKRLNSLIPVDDAAEELLRRIKHGDQVMVDVRRPRSLPQHRLLMGVLQTVYENLPDDVAQAWNVRSFENFREVTKYATGLTDKFWVQGHWSGGHWVVMPRPTNFEDMDQTEFAAWFDRVMDWLCVEVIPGLEKDDLLDQVNEMLGVNVG